MVERRIRVYIAGPYTSDPAGNTARAIAAGDCLLLAGLAPYVPHVSHYWNACYPHPWETWMALDFEWVLACAAVVRLPGASTGADMETRLARKNGIPVFDSVEACIEWTRYR